MQLRAVEIAERRRKREERDRAKEREREEKERRDEEEKRQREQQEREALAARRREERKIAKQVNVYGHTSSPLSIKCGIRSFMGLACTYTKCITVETCT